MKHVCIVTGTIAILMFLGTVGASDAGLITTGQLGFRLAVEMLMMAASYGCYQAADRRIHE